MQKCLLVALWIALVQPALADPAYISDEFTVPLRSGPSLRHKILNAGLPTGTRVDTLAQDEASGFTQVRLRDGTEGWLPTQFLTGEPIARVRLGAATRQIESLQAELASVRNSLKQTTASSADADRINAELAERSGQLEAELAEIKRLSANALALDATNEALEVRNAELQAEVADLTRAVSSLERDVRLRWLLFGGGLVLTGVAIGFALSSRRKRSSWA